MSKPPYIPKSTTPDPDVSVISKRIKSALKKVIGK